MATSTITGTAKTFTYIEISNSALIVNLKVTDTKPVENMDSERNGINGGQKETESSSSVMVNDQQKTKYGSHDNCVGNFVFDMRALLEISM